MKNNVILFSIDRLGDYLIRSNVIKKISQNFEKVEIVGSNLNSKLLNTQKFIHQIYTFNTENKFYEKIKFIKLFLFKKYDTVIIFDGKNISNILLFLINANFKFTFLYKKKHILNSIYLRFLKLIYPIFNIKYEILLSKDLIDKKHSENYPIKYRKLKEYFFNIDNKTYYLENNLLNTHDNLTNRFIILHLDEKFKDIKNIDTNLESSLIKFQKQLKIKIFLTTFNNDFTYYRNLNFKKIMYKDLLNKDLINSEILIIENIPINYFHNFMKNSYLNISCHSGLFVHSSLSLNKKTIDIIHESQENWLNTWIDYKKDYIKIYKSYDNKTYDIGEILESIYEQIK